MYIVPLLPHKQNVNKSPIPYEPEGAGQNASSEGVFHLTVTEDDCTDGTTDEGPVKLPETETVAPAGILTELLIDNNMPRGLEKP